MMSNGSRCYTWLTVDEPVDLAKHVIVGDVPLEAEAVEKRLLHHTSFTHHRPNLPLLLSRESAT